MRRHARMDGHAAHGWASSRRAATLIAVAAALVFANALGNGFALDDTSVILTNPLVHRMAGVWLAFAHSYWPEATGAGQYRPLTVATFALDWALTAGSPMWLHAVNVAWHAVVCVLVWRLLAEWCSPVAAIAGALVFAVHPVHVEAVANLVGRGELLCAAFSIAALLAHRRGSWFAIPLYAAALCSKETGVAFVGLAIASDVLLPATTGGALGDAESNARVAPVITPWQKGLAVHRRLYLGYAFVTIGYGALLAGLFREQPLVRTAVIWQHDTLVERWLTAARVVPEYARLLLFPARLHVDYGPRVIDLVSRPTPTVLVGLAMLLAALVAIGFLARRAPVLAFAVSLLAIAILPVSNLIFPTGIILAERTLYLPSVALALVVGWCVDRWRVVPMRSWRGAVAAGPILAAGALLALGVRTWTRTPIWKSNKTVMIASLEGEPTSYRAHEQAADVLNRAGDAGGAIREYAVARSLYADDPMLYQAPATLLVGLGPAGDAAAARLLDSARAIDPSPYQDALRRAWVRYAAGDYRGAIRWSRAAYLMERDSVNAVMVLTQAAQQINDVDDAGDAFRMALADHPHSKALHQSYAAMLRAAGDTAGARVEQQAR